MILLTLVTLLISLMCVTKAPVVNILIIYYELNYLKTLILGGSDIFAANNGVLHEGGSLTTVGGNIKGVGASCHIVYRNIALSQFINHKQSNHSITA